MTDIVIDDPMLDDEWLAAPQKRSRLRTLLVLALAAAVCFLGGALVQKHYGTASTSAAAAGPSGFAGGQLPEGLPEGFAQGGLPADVGTATDDDSQSVIGEVVEVRGDVWIVEDLGGNRHEVQVGDATDVVRESSITPSQVKVGDPVDITGTDSDGRLQADEVTLR
ncbi:MAG: hypothetical protein WCS84_15875 [Nocardioides sp.]